MRFRMRKRVVVVLSVTIHRGVVAAGIAMFGLSATALLAASSSANIASKPDVPAAAAMVQIDCDRRAPQCRLVAKNVQAAAVKGAAPAFRLRELWRYVPLTRRWVDVTPPRLVPIPIRAANKPGADRPNESSQVLFELPRTVGLYRLRWMESGAHFESDAIVGTVLCNDLLVDEPTPPGTYIGCWPTALGAMAGFVTNPPRARK